MGDVFVWREFSAQIQLYIDRRGKFSIASMEVPMDGTAHSEFREYSAGEFVVLPDAAYLRETSRWGATLAIPKMVKVSGSGPSLQVSLDWSDAPKARAFSSRAGTSTLASLERLVDRDMSMQFVAVLRFPVSPSPELRSELYAVMSELLVPGFYDPLSTLSLWVPHRNRSVVIERVSKSAMLARFLVVSSPEFEDGSSSR